MSGLAGSLHSSTLSEHPSPLTSSLYLLRRARLLGSPRGGRSARNAWDSGPSGLSSHRSTWSAKIPRGHASPEPDVRPARAGEGPVEQGRRKVHPSQMVQTRESDGPRPQPFLELVRQRLVREVGPGGVVRAKEGDAPAGPPCTVVPREDAKTLFSHTFHERPGDLLGVRLPRASRSVSGCSGLPPKEIEACTDVRLGDTRLRPSGSRSVRSAASSHASPRTPNSVPFMTIWESRGSGASRRISAPWRVTTPPDSMAPSWTSRDRACE